jgi:hypothetical protein
MNNNMVLIVVVLIFIAALAGCGPSTPAITVQGNSSDLFIYHPQPGIVCYSKSNSSLSCLYEVTP